MIIATHTAEQCVLDQGAGDCSCDLNTIEITIGGLNLAAQGLFGTASHEVDDAGWRGIAEQCRLRPAKNLDRGNIVEIADANRGAVGKDAIDIDTDAGFERSAATRSRDAANTHIGLNGRLLR